MACYGCAGVNWALHCPFASIEDSKPALHSHSLEYNMCIPEQPMKKHYMLARSILWHLWPAMAVLVSIGLSFLSISILGMSKYLESREVTELQ